jgi:hypothetical protein
MVAGFAQAAPNAVLLRFAEGERRRRGRARALDASARIVRGLRRAIELPDLPAGARSLQRLSVHPLRLPLWAASKTRRASPK